MYLAPISLKAANEYVKAHHRHHGPTVGHKFSISVRDDKGIRGVVICGRPVSRGYDDGNTLEITRVATDGCPNACSMLYGAALRAAKAMGYSRAVTYTLPDEGGASLRAAGWKEAGTTAGGSWNCVGRPRIDKAPTCAKTRWEIDLKQRNA